MRFKKPTPDEVTNYARKIGFILDGNQFCDYYESKGWVVGKAPMKVWQAAVRTWKAKEPRSDRWGAPKPSQVTPDADKVKAAKERMDAIREREFEKRELVRLAQERDDKRSQKMMEAAGEKEEIEWQKSSVSIEVTGEQKPFDLVGISEIKKKELADSMDKWIRDLERQESSD